MVNNKILYSIVGISLLMGWTNTLAFSNYNVNSIINVKQKISDTYTRVDNNNIRAIVPKDEVGNINTINANINNDVKVINTNTNSNISNIKDILADNNERTIFDNILTGTKITKPILNHINLPISKIDIKNYYISFSYSTIMNTKFSKITLQTGVGATNKNTIIDTNLVLTPWQNLRIVLLPNRLKVVVDWKIVFNKNINVSWKYNKIILDIDNNLIFKNTKINYIWSDYLNLKNKLLTANNTLHNDIINVTKQNIKTVGINIINKQDRKNITWDKIKWKFIVNTTTLNQNIIKLHLDPTLANRVDKNKNIYDILQNIDTVFTWLTFKSNSTDFDGNSKTKEYIYQDSNWVYYVYQMVTNKTIVWTTKTTITINVKLIYKWTEDILTMTNIELDWNSNTKEWYTQNKIYTAILQYKDSSMRRVLYNPDMKIYFSNLLTKNGVQWKVLFALKTDLTEIAGKRYVTPFIELLWFDDTKQKYYVKQVKDYTNFNTFNIKLGTNYIFKKDAWVVDYVNTDFLN